KIKETNA
nr:RecName: Full=Peptide 1196 [Tityus stigmurus]